MDTNECQPLYIEIREFYEGLNMKVQQQIPLLLVERQALNEAMEGEKQVRTTHPTFFLGGGAKNILTCLASPVILTLPLVTCRVITTCQRQEDFAYQKNRLSEQ